MKTKTWLTCLAIIGLALSSFTFGATPTKPSYAAQPTLLQLLGSPIAVAARTDFLKQYSKSSKRSANLSYHVDPLFNKSLKHEIMVDTQVSADFWAHIRPVDQKVQVYIAQSNNLQYVYKYMWPT